MRNNNCNDIPLAVAMFKAHSDFRFEIHKIAERSGSDEKELLRLAVEVLTDELEDFIPEKESCDDVINGIKESSSELIKYC